MKLTVIPPDTLNLQYWYFLIFMKKKYETLCSTKNNAKLIHTNEKDLKNILI